MINKEDNYLWEESFGDEKGRPQQPAVAATGHSSSFNSSAILQDMLKDVSDTPPTQPKERVTDDEPLFIRAPLMPALQGGELPREKARPSSSAVQSLLQLAEEAEKQARLTSEAADTANKLAAELIEEMQNGGEGLQQLCVTAGKNAYLAAEAAVRAQLSAMETHAAAVNQSLAELENAKDTLHHHSQGFIHLSKLAAQAQEESDLAREKSERARLEYAAKQNAALGNRDALAQSKREYETKLSQTRFAQENLDLAQKKARAAQNEYLRLKESLSIRRKQWQSIQHMQPEPLPQHLQQQIPASPKTQPTQPQEPQITPTEQVQVAQLPQTEQSPTLPEQAPQEATMAAETALPAPMAAERRQIAALVLPLPKAEQIAEAEQQTELSATEFVAEEPAQELAGEAVAQAAIFEESEEEENIKRSFWRIYGKIMLLALAIAICLRLFVLDVVMVDGRSMQPTLHDADSLISSKLAYVFQEPQRFDIILMDAPDGNGYYIKRVIGLPNDHLRIEEGQVYINDAPLSQPFISETYTKGDVNTVIPDGYYFVMGDNRAESRDSRESEIGPVAREHVTGKAIVRIFPLNSMAIL